MKTKARDVVDLCYADALKPSITDNINSDQYFQLIADNVKTLLDDSTFLLAPELDDKVSILIHILQQQANYSYQGRSSNFAHPAIIELCQKFYYGGKSDSLANLFPTEFTTLPRGSLAMACTCVSFKLI